MAEVRRNIKIKIDFCVNNFVSRDIFRYEATLLRHRFDLNKDEKDPRVAQKLLAEGEEELFQNMHYQPRQCK